MRIRELEKLVINHGVSQLMWPMTLALEGVLLLPILIIQKIDKKKGRDFFWVGDDTCSGAQCLVACERVCSPKENGGLGVKNLYLQNVCLLLKFCYKTLHSDSTLERVDHSPLPPRT